MFGTRTQEISFFTAFDRRLSILTTRAGIIFLLVACSRVHAQETTTSQSSGPQSQAADNAKNAENETEDSNETSQGDSGQHLQNVITLHSAPEPDPILRYRFWPALDDQKNLNAMQPILRAAIFIEQDYKQERWQIYYGLYKKVVDFIEQAKGRNHSLTNVSEIDSLVDDLDAFIGDGGGALHNIQIAENLMLVENLGAEGDQVFSIAQSMRDLSRFLQMRAFVLIHEQRWDEFFQVVRQCFRLAQFAAKQSDFMVDKLISQLIANETLDVVEYAVQQPHCPNLYWALLATPTDFLIPDPTGGDTGQGFIFSYVGELPNTPIGMEAAREKLLGISKYLLEWSGSDEPDPSIVAYEYVVNMSGMSRELLSQEQHWGERVAELSDAEVVLRATLIRYKQASERSEAWALLQKSVISEDTSDLQEMYSHENVRRKYPDDWVLIECLSWNEHTAAYENYREIKARINRLLTVEAIRMHASEMGEFPLTLDRLRPVPAHLDYLTNQPMAYERISPTEASLSTSSFDDSNEVISEKIETLSLRRND